MSETDQAEEAIFNVARLFRDSKKLNVFLDLACDGNPDMRQRIEGLLGAAGDAEDFFNRNSAPLGRLIVPLEAGAIITNSASEGPGSIVERYKLLEKIGEGGFGIVYLAEQKEPVKRQVALKIIKLGMDTRQVVARFEAERQALALMDHPNIAKVLDGGATDSGRPYFVMELVRGLPITQYCDENQLSAGARLELFLQVCQAVQHAHQKGIIHRDLKPSNILVTLSEPGLSAVPKIIDFGVAKATQQELTEKTIFTQFHHFIGTPAYMSPEQASMTSIDIDTRSDIYSLGVLLYELLVGRTPFDSKELTQAGLDEMRRMICEKEPVRPSTRISGLTRSDQDTAAKARSTEPLRLRSLLKGDLDWIVMRCLEKDRSRRYETANGLGADIKRHLNDEPVVARPPTAVYRLQKAVRRNKLAFTASVAIAIALLAGVAASSWQAVRAERSRRQANQRLEAALVFVDAVFSGVVPEIRNLTGAANARESLAEAGLKFVQSLEASASDDPKLRVTLAHLLLAVSGAQNPGTANSVGDYENGLRRAEEALQLLSTKIPGLNPEEQLYLRFWAKNNMVYCLAGLGRWDETVARAQELEPLLDQLERVPERARWAQEVRMIVRTDTGAAMISAGRPREALEKYILPFLNSDYARSITNTSTEDELKSLICACDSLTAAYCALKQFEEMVPAADQAARVAELLVQRFPLNARCAWGLAFSRSQQGYALVRIGRFDTGLATLRKAREEIEDLVGKDQANDGFRANRAMIAATQASAFASWSQELSAPLSERLQRLAQAQAYLVEAEEFCRASKSKEPEIFRNAARDEVAAAKAKLERDVRAPTKP